MPSELTKPNDAILDLKVPLTEGDHAQGSPHAGVTLLEYGDYECPFFLNGVRHEGGWDYEELEAAISRNLRGREAA